MKVSLKAARVNRNMSQEDAAKRLNVSKSTVSKWERGIAIPNVKQIPKIEQVYGVCYDDIIFLHSNNA